MDNKPLLSEAFVRNGCRINPKGGKDEAISLAKGREDDLDLRRYAVVT